MLAESTFATRTNSSYTRISAAFVQEQVQEEAKIRLQKGRAQRFLHLLEVARLVSSQDLSEAREIAQALGQELEQVLVSSGFMSKNLLKLVRQAQLFIEQERCTEELACLGLNIAWRKELSFEEGLRYFGWGW